VNWTFTHDQFAYAWELADADQMPYPLNVRPSARTEDERAEHLRELKPWREETVDADLQVALGLLASAPIRLTAFGTDGPGRVRILGAASGPTATVVGQSADEAGELNLWLGKRAELVELFIAQFPECPTGREQRRAAPFDEVQREPSMLASPTTETDSKHIRRVLRQPKTGVGYLLAELQIESHAPPVERSLSWVDVTGDGRYLVRPGDHVELIPAAPAVVSAELHKLLAESDRR
jgi:EspG family